MPPSHAAPSNAPAPPPAPCFPSRLAQESAASPLFAPTQPAGLLQLLLLLLLMMAPLRPAGRGCSHPDVNPHSAASIAPLALYTARLDPRSSSATRLAAPPAASRPPSWLPRRCRRCRHCSPACVAPSSSPHLASRLSLTHRHWPAWSVGRQPPMEPPPLRRLECRRLICRLAGGRLGQCPPCQLRRSGPWGPAMGKSRRATREGLSLGWRRCPR